jgi:hypothetical protein
MKVTQKTKQTKVKNTRTYYEVVGEFIHGGDYKKCEVYATELMSEIGLANAVVSLIAAGKILDKYPNLTTLFCKKILRAYSLGKYIQYWDNLPMDCTCDHHQVLARVNILGGEVRKYDIGKVGYKVMDIELTICESLDLNLLARTFKPDVVKES